MQPPYPPQYPGPYPPPYPAQYGAVQFGYPQPVPPPRRTNPVFAAGVLAAAALLIVAAVLPWARLDGLNWEKKGTEGDGALTLGLAVLMGAMAVLALVLRRQIWSAIVALVAAVLCGLIAVIDIADVRSRVGDLAGSGVGISVGIGLWLTLAGAVLGLAASIGGLVRR